jgi:hypothetical protein
MPPRRKSGSGSHSGNDVPALGNGAAPALVSTPEKYGDESSVNEAHMLQVNTAMDTVREAMPGGAGKNR